MRRLVLVLGSAWGACAVFPEHDTTVPCWAAHEARAGDLASPCYCTPGSPSLRHAERDFLTPSQVNFLLGVAEKGMKAVSPSINGPTIMDPDLGLVLGPGAKQIALEDGLFTEDDIAQYTAIMQKTHEIVAKIHGIAPELIFHTAPTFIARLSGRGKPGQALHVHDEYFHLHADKNNTEHYDLSALVYLSDYGADFEGGVFEFHDPNDMITPLYPQRGMFITFRSGPENAHRVTRVTKGVRFAFSTWWTCDKTKRLKKSKLKMKTEL